MLNLLLAFHVLVVGLTEWVSSGGDWFNAALYRFYTSPLCLYRWHRASIFGIKIIWLCQHTEVADKAKVTRV